MSIRPTGAFGLELGRQEVLLNVRKAQGAGRACVNVRVSGQVRLREPPSGGHADGKSRECFGGGGSEPTCLGSEQLEVRLEKAEPAELGGCKPMQEALFPSVSPLPPHVS